MALPGSVYLWILIIYSAFSGPESDPNAVPGNPGFELEIATYNSTGSDGGVRVFNVDGMDTASVVKHYASIHSNYQVSHALNQDPGCSVRVPAFVDMYIPFSALGVLSTTQIRMAVAVNEDPKTPLGGGASDIGGVNGHLITDDDDQFIAAILNYSPIAIGNSSNQAPVVDDVSTSLDENSANGTAMHTVSGADPNGDVLSYTITSGNVGMAFAIDSISGEITVNNSAVLDAETTSAFTLLVRVSDGKLYNNAIITVNLNDANEYPPSATDASVALNENTTNTTVVHTVVATDPDITPALGYSITEGNTGIAFAINSSSGEITVNNSSALDFETTPSFTLTVRVSDGAFF